MSFTSITSFMVVCTVRPAKVLMSETTRSSLPEGIEVIAYESLQLKGSSSKQPIYQLLITVLSED